MQLSHLQQEIAHLCKRLLIETENYETALTNNKDLHQVKILYADVKQTTRNLRQLIIQFDQLLNAEMQAFDNLKQSG